MKKWLGGVVLALCGASAQAAGIVLVPVTDSHPEGLVAMQAFAEDSAWRVHVQALDQDHVATPEAVALELPSPFKGGQLLSQSVLPLQPHSSIYRFKNIAISPLQGVDLPFRYVEIDWNTEGLPRGPNGSFINPHFDFHFYTKSQAYVDRELHCVTTGKTCDGLKTGYAQMRRFLNLPPSEYLPTSYFPDSGSSIAQMGLHNLNGAFEYSIDHVNHNPVIIYGSFDGQIIFLEASLTLYAFQDAILAAQSNETLRWSVPQPGVYGYAWWPNSMTLGYDAGRNVFTFALSDFEQHVAIPIE